MKTLALRIALLCSVAVLTACGSDTPTSAVDNSTTRGTLVENPPFRIASVDAMTLAAELGASASGTQLLQVTGAPACGVDFNYMHYYTVNASPTGDVPASASAALMIPTGAAPACSGPRPILLYAHGTQTDKAANLADITDPNNSEGALIAAMFAAQGYIVVAPNYVGYDTSDGTFHPYLNADAQSKDMIDALTAARKALGKVLASTTTDNGQLFISGYSQGGYVAMATHKALQAAGMTVTASAPMSGPYALEAFGDAVFFGKVNLGSTIFTPLLTTSYQKSYGNIYSATSDIFEDAYSASIEGLLPSTTPIDTLISTGKLPQLQLFNSTTPVTGNATLDALLAEPSDPNDPRTPLFRLGFGTMNLVKNSFRVAYVADAAGQPDGALLPQPTFQLATAPTNTLRLAFKQNDLRSWIPQVPVLMCGGGNDPVVFFPVNTITISYWWEAQGVPVARTAVAIPTSLVTVLDLEAGLGAGDPFALAEGGFATAKGAIYQAAYDSTVAAGGDAAAADQAGQFAVVQSYHTTVAPFCSAAARGFFSQFLGG
ncbi:MAG: prolyl oligopeptidase family serine peptidase [Proteobacteria bacterium]|nr:prolyl oligopeptidase family serine peptidase [Pseudomonadota bacterium]